MKIVNQRALMQIVLGVIALASILLTYYYQQSAVLILTIQLTLLTLTYSFGSNYIENKIKEDYEEINKKNEEDIESLMDAFKDVVLEKQELKNKLTQMKIKSKKGV